MIPITREEWTPADVGCYWHFGTYTIASRSIGTWRGYVLYHNRRELSAGDTFEGCARVAREHAASSSQDARVLREGHPTWPDVCMRDPR